MQLQDARDILLCLRYGIGDVVMETPLLEALRRTVPHARITALAAEPAVELIEEDPRVDEVVSVARWGLTHRWDSGDEETRRALRAWLDAGRFDLHLDVHHAPEAVGRVIWSTGVRSLESDEAVEAAAAEARLGAVAAIKRAVRAGWGLEVPPDSPPRLHLTQRAREFAARFVRERSPGGAPVALSPVASLPMKRWPVERFAALADGLAERTEGAVLLLCGPQRDACDATVAAMRRADRVVRVGPLHLSRVAALLRRCRLFAGNDTGLMHMAAAVGVPTIGVFGPTSPHVFLPPAGAVGVGGWEVECPYRHESSLHPPGCWASGRCLVGPTSCITAVSVEDVMVAADAALRKGTSIRTLSATGGGVH